LEINKEHEILRQQYTMFKSRFEGMLRAQLDALEKTGDNLER
jgi:cell division initiation protein